MGTASSLLIIILFIMQELSRGESQWPKLVSKYAGWIGKEKKPIWSKISRGAEQMNHCKFCEAFMT